MRILGIDPGTARMGYGIVEDAGAGRERAVEYGCLETPPDMRPELRLQALYRGLADLMARPGPTPWRWRSSSSGGT